MPCEVKADAFKFSDYVIKELEFLWSEVVHAYERETAHRWPQKRSCFP